MQQLLAISIIDSRQAPHLNRNVVEESLMRWNMILISMAAITGSVAPLAAASFGTVVPIRGQSSDIALDESRGLLYIANFTAGQIEVMSTSDNIVHSSIPVSLHPGSLALSPDGNYLLAANYQNGTSTPQGTDVLTLINLTSRVQQTFSTGDPPLGAAFIADPNNRSSSGLALIATTTGFYLFDPISGTLQFIDSFANAAKSLPVPQATFPPQILQTAMTTAADGVHIWGVADAGTGSQLIYLYDGTTGRMTAQTWVTTPALLPRVSVAADGSWAMIGWNVFVHSQCGPGFAIRTRFTGAAASTNVTGHAIDSKNGIIYAEIPDGTQPSGPPYTPATPAGQAPPAKLPAFSIMDSDNLTVRDRIYIPENMTGRTLLNKAASMMYAVSDSGVMILPVGSMNKSRRLTVSTEDLQVQSSFCNRNAMKQTFTISDPGGNNTDFSISTTQAGVTIAPLNGTTPATVTVTVDPAAFQNTYGTLAVPLQISSYGAVNVPPALRLLISQPDQDQRGTIIDVAGRLTDILPDPGRNRFYVVRQDKNQLLVFNGGNNQQIAALRTGTNPSRISLTNDGKSLIVANTDSQFLQAFDLDSLQPQTPIELPPGHYGRSPAQSNAAMFVVVENDAVGPGNVDRIDLVTRCAVTPPALGIWANTMAPTSVLTPSPSQGTILLAEPDGNVKLYDAQANTWVLSRKDLPSLSGAYAAADPPGPPTASLPDNPTDIGTYVVGNSILNPALVPIGTMDQSVGNTVGFAFTGQDQKGYRVTGTVASGPGVIQNMPALRVSLPSPVQTGPSANVKPVRVAEAPILSTTDVPFTRTVAPLPSAGTVVVLSTSGVTVLSNGYDAAVAPPLISSIVNAADGTKPVAPGGLVSIFGSNMSATNVATSQMPLPTALGQSCLVVNGTLVPLLFVSSSQINAQLPSRVGGSATLTIHTPGGVSDNYNFSVNSTAPSVFQSGAAGPQTGLATIIRADNGELVTPTNPVRSNSSLVIYLTGMGATSPAVSDGMPAPDSPLASAIVTPTVTLGGTPLSIYYAGLVPGLVGVYQINAVVPLRVPEGIEVPLVIDQGGSSTTLNVRVVQ
jgi:uncharacterized protein (TIGR03437 family)